MKAETLVYNIALMTLIGVMCWLFHSIWPMVFLACVASDTTESVTTTDKEEDDYDLDHLARISTKQTKSESPK